MEACQSTYNASFQDVTFSLVWMELLESRSILVLLESCLKTCVTYTIAECTVNKILMMGRGTARNM